MRTFPVLCNLVGMQFRRIVLIDDDEDDQEIFQLVLSRISSSVDCTCFDDASFAYEMLRSSLLLPDVIFLDLNMPGMNGQQFLTKIKQGNGTLHKIPVIIFTTASDAGIKQQMKALGAYDFITKPGDINALKGLLTPFIT